MGIWRSERGRVSDEMADILSEALERIGDLRYQMDPEPEFTIVDLADAIEYATYGFLVVEVNPKLQEVIDHSIVGKEPNPPTASSLKVSEIDSMFCPLDSSMPLSVGDDMRPTDKHIDFRNLPNRGEVF